MRILSIIFASLAAFGLLLLIIPGIAIIFGVIGKLL